jgi:hypothetical protein
MKKREFERFSSVSIQNETLNKQKNSFKNRKEKGRETQGFRKGPEDEHQVLLRQIKGQIPAILNSTCYTLSPFSVFQIAYVYGQSFAEELTSPKRLMRAIFTFLLLLFTCKLSFCIFK